MQQGFKFCLRGGRRQAVENVFEVAVVLFYPLPLGQQLFSLFDRFGFGRCGLFVGFGLAGDGGKCGYGFLRGLGFDLGGQGVYLHEAQYPVFHFAPRVPIYPAVTRPPDV